MARLNVARLKRTIFHERVGGATKRGASKTKNFPRKCWWRDNMLRVLNDLYSTSLLVARLNVALVKRTIFRERVCGSSVHLSGQLWFAPEVT